MWQSIFVDLLTMVGIFAAGFLLGRGTWPRRYQTMKRRWLDKRNEVRHLREQLYGENPKGLEADFAPPDVGPEDTQLEVHPVAGAPPGRARP